MKRNIGASRRAVVRGLAGTVGAAALAPIAAMAQQPIAATGAPPTVISNPPRQWGHHAPPSIYPDPDVIVIDPSFAALRVGNNAIHRVATDFTWAEGQHDRIARHRGRPVEARRRPGGPEHGWRATGYPQPDQQA